jgi:hypothetical protein
LLALLLLPAALQALVMSVDELVFHRKRGLPRWERLGHPLDTLTAALCYGWLVAVPARSPHGIVVYVALCAFSCLFITKDEFVHARLCEPLEAWLHALLFVLHPLVFLAFFVIWRSGAHEWVIQAALVSCSSLLIYQVAYWNWRGRHQPRAEGDPRGSAPDPAIPRRQ